MQFTIQGQTVRLNLRDAPALLAAVQDHLDRGQGFALATLNMDHLVKLGRDLTFAKAYAAHDMVVADGNPVVWLSRLAARPVSLVPGSDMVIPMTRIAVKTGRPVVLFGSTPESLEQAEQAMAQMVPGLRVARRIAPPMGFDPTGEEARRLLQELAEIGPCLCLLALGAPKQEILAAMGRQIAPLAGFASIGAGLDFLSGRQIRAPRWARAMALEWLWRAITTPRRMVPRYLACAAILPVETVKAFLLRRR